MATIAITSSFAAWPDEEAAQQRLNNYGAAVLDAGARAEYLFLGEAAPGAAAKVAAQFDGLLISGGSDLPPEYYGEVVATNANVELVPEERPLLEFALLKEFAAQGKPVLGICYGFQLLNVWLGGGLVQDIPTLWPDAEEHQKSRHEIRIAHGSALARIVSATELDVNSFHHQGVAHAAPRARATAYAGDGIVEAIECDAPILGVQWHPERDRESEATQRLFAAFLQGFQS